MMSSALMSNFKLTLDGEPLVRTLEGFASVDTSRINSYDPIYALAHPLVPLIGVPLYLCSEPVVAKVRDIIGVKKDSAILKSFVFVHNALLTVFSAWVMVNIWPLAYSYYSAHGFKSMLVDKAFWNQGLGMWSYIFYMSKYYEFIDSWVLTLKGYPVSFLQSYHHAGIVLSMYAGCLSESNWLVFVVALNSFIHTLMYTYFSAATMGYKSPLASHLTKAQLLQFMIGITVPAGLLGWEEPSSAVKGSFVFIQVYAVGLIGLFGQMYVRKYNQGSAKKSSKGSGVRVEVDMQAQKKAK